MVSEDRKLKVESKIIENSINITVLWDTARLKSSDYVVDVMCNIDKVVTSRGVSSLMKGAFLCQECSSRAETIKSLESNFKVVDRNLSSNSGRMLIVECNACKTRKTISRSNLFTQDKIKCEHCEDLKLIEILSNNGAKFLYKKMRGRFMTAFYQGIDGKLMYNSVSNILTGRGFSVSENHWDRSHYLYVFVSTDTNYPFIKIGTANTPSKRLRDLKLDFNCEIAAQVSFENRREATKLERFLHKKFKDQRINKEVTTDFTKAVSKQRKKDGTQIKMGYTEWFSIEIKEDLLSTINDIE